MTALAETLNLSFTAHDPDIPVYVALSGGVDSAVAACLLKQHFKTVIGVSHRHWPESRCCSTECIDRCAQQCADMGIPYYPVDCMVEFAQQIVDNFVATYERGMTPNPCVLCNEQIRFDLMLRKHFELEGQDIPDRYFLATGHYARVEERDGRFHLMKGEDETKDQSYMLHRLSQEELSHCLFPLGSVEKSVVREIAEQYQLTSAKIGDSMDICFVQDTYQDFLKQYSEKPQKPGDIVNASGDVLGQHNGIAYYTRGQRSGLGLSGGPWYVSGIDASTNTVTVGRRDDLLVSSVRVTDLHWTYPETAEPFTCRMQTRYRSREAEVTVTPLGGGEALITLGEPSHDITLGQSAVFYKGADVIGGGIMCGFSVEEDVEAGRS